MWGICVTFAAGKVCEDMRILVVDDEPDLCEILRYNLGVEGYEVDTALSGEEAMRMDVASYDLLLLDVMMEGMSGFELARALRQRAETADLPIIFITALGSEDDMVRGLNLGADDYITKPLSLREVKARVMAVMRRRGLPQRSSLFSSQGEDIVVYEALSLDPVGKTVTLDGERLPLTKLEFELLSLLMRHRGRLFDRESLIAKCWPEGTVVSDRTVDVSIARLRRKMKRYGSCIKARIGYGYTFE